MDLFTKWSPQSNCSNTTASYSQGDIEIKEIDPCGKYIKIINNSDQTQCLQNAVIIQLEGVHPVNIGHCQKLSIQAKDSKLLDPTISQKKLWKHDGCTTILCNEGKLESWIREPFQWKMYPCPIMCSVDKFLTKTEYGECCGENDQDYFTSMDQF